jgi:hypothetical protein
MCLKKPIADFRLPIADWFGARNQIGNWQSAMIISSD